MQIALAQIDCRLGNLPANVATHREAAKAATGADLLVFPELSLTGYRLRSNTHRVMLDDSGLMEHWDGVEAAMPCVAGYVELTPRAALHNTMALLVPDMVAPAFRHRKVYLPTYGMFEEERYLRPGDRFRSTELPAADGERWRVGLLCCEDAWHASAWAVMQARGVDLVVVSSASPGRGVESERLGSQRSWYGILSTFAELSGAWVLFCNRVGFEDDIHFWGGSAAFAPTGAQVAEAPLLEPHLLRTEISRSAVVTARLDTPLVANEDWAVTLRELDDALAEKLEE